MAKPPTAWDEQQGSSIPSGGPSRLMRPGLRENPPPAHLSTVVLSDCGQADEDLVSQVSVTPTCTSRHNDCDCTRPMMAQSECNVGWLIFVLRARRRQQVRRWRGPREPFPRPWLIPRGRDLPDEALRQRIRERLADGSLFPASGMSVARRGTGRA